MAKPISATERPSVVVAINGLNAGDRDALILHVWEHLPYEGVAAALGIPVGTVRSRLFRARNSLQRLLDDVAPERGKRAKRVVN